MSSPVRLTQYSSGAGCGCKISPQMLDEILAGSGKDGAPDPRLVIGNEMRDDAAAWLLEDDETLLLATTDFFMPIVDDPYDFGRIAAANAISDIFAMGGRPVMALAVLGWPIDKLPPALAGDVVRGARAICSEAGMVLAGGHSIDSPEPIFGLAVNGLVKHRDLKANEGAQVGDLLYLTKPLGVGILATAEKRGKLLEADRGLAAASMTRLNSIGAKLAAIEGVHAMTDVTGFGFFGHLLEMCRSSGVRGQIEFSKVPQIADLRAYLDAGMAPGGTTRNWSSYGADVDCPSDFHRSVLSDPQTSGGLLVSVDPSAQLEVEEVFAGHDLALIPRPLGTIEARGESESLVVVR